MTTENNNLTNTPNSEFHDLEEKIKEYKEKITKLDNEANEYRISKKMKKFFNITTTTGTIIACSITLGLSLPFISLCSAIIGLTLLGFNVYVFGTNKNIDNTIKFLLDQKDIQNCLLTSEETKLTKLKKFYSKMETSDKLVSDTTIKPTVAPEPIQAKAKTRTKIIDEKNQK